MRKVKVTKSRYVQSEWVSGIHVPGYSTQDPIGEGVFCGYFQQSQETTDGLAYYPVSIVEMQDGTVRECLINEITFLEPIK